MRNDMMPPPPRARLGASTVRRAFVKGAYTIRRLPLFRAAQNRRLAATGLTQARDGHRRAGAMQLAGDAFDGGGRRRLRKQTNQWALAAHCFGHARGERDE